jgi:type I restriction enzyme S subunit
MKKYKQYKPVELGWLDSVPTHWEVKKLKHIASLNSGDSITAETISPEGLYPVYGGNGLRGYTDLRTHEGRFVLIGRQGHLCGNINYAQGEFFASEHALVATPRTTYETTWLGELLRAMNLGQYSQAAAQPGLSADRLQNLNIPIPPLPEQRAIAAYLDHKTAQLDTLLTQKEALLQLLHKKREAIINETVTQGLDPAAPRKPSGVAWLGDVPAHWEIRKITRAFSKIGSGTTPEAGLDKYYQDGTINWVNTGDLNDGILESCQKRVTELALKDCSALKVYPAGTILVAMYGATIGKTSLMNFEACTNQACCALTVGPVLNEQFALYWFLANKQHIISLGYGGGQPNISQDTIRQLHIQTPPLAEQKEIVDFIKSKVNKINKAATAIHTQIQALKDYRQSLISEVVTGKVDVRAAKSVAPEADLPLWRHLV